jgi:hypothetical protein
MTVQELYNLIKSHSYMKNRTEQEVLTIFENAYRSILSRRDEEVDLLSDRPRKLISTRRLNERLGIQKIDTKLSEKFPKLTPSERLLLYRIAQIKVYRWHPEEYEFATHMQNTVLDKVFSPSLNLLTGIVRVSEKTLSYVSQLGLRFFGAINQSVEYASGINLKLTLVDATRRIFTYTPALSLLVHIAKAYVRESVYGNNLSLRLSLISSKARTIQLYSNFSLGLRKVTEYDHLRSAAYESQLNLTCKIE